MGIRRRTLTSDNQQLVILGKLCLRIWGEGKLQSGSHIRLRLYVFLAGMNTREGKLQRRELTSQSCSAKVKQTGIRFFFDSSSADKISVLAAWQATKIKSCFWIHVTFAHKLVIEQCEHMQAKLQKCNKEIFHRGLDQRKQTVGVMTP